MTDPVTDAVVAAAMNVPDDLLEAGADAVEGSPQWSSDAQSRFVNASPADHYRQHAERIGTAWSEIPDLPGAALAAAIRAATATVDATRAASRISLVWTGPATDSLGLRSTRSVLSTLVGNAVESVLLVSFASYDVVELTNSLLVAIDRGVEVTLILETPDNPGGPLVIGPNHPFAPIRDKAQFFRWPVEAREAFFTQTARLHAKCVIADRSAALITSANLTNAGINDNIELGVLIESGSLPTELHDHLTLLIQGGTLEPAI